MIQNNLWSRFLIENKFDFLLSTEAIKWQGIKISIHNNDKSRKKKECVIRMQNTKKVY